MIVKGLIFQTVSLLLIVITPLCYAESNISIENGLRIVSRDGQHKFHLGGYLLFDAYAVDQTDSSFERFDLFNAWVHIVGTSYDNYEYKVQYSLEDKSTTKLRDAYIAYLFTPKFKLLLGQYDVPTIAEHLSSLTYTTLAGRSIVDSLTPGRDVGVMAKGISTNKNWQYSVGLFNGNGVDANGEDNNSKDIAGRITGLIFQGKNINTTRVYTDLSFTQGKQDLNSFRFRSESGEVMIAATDVPVDGRLRLAGGLYAFMGSSSLNAVYLKNSYELTDSQTADAKAWSILFAHLLTGEQEVYQSGLYQKIRPRHNYTNGHGGAWQLALRYSQWQADDTLVQAAETAALSTVAADSAKAISL